ncbi:MAG: TetR/AcrR family transcriptional regulator [candidate division Zixibacteria bacterium]|nr:TetR/AcrR family transcriptional regulator [candidate division Zixibacteria bacterium]NIW45024.1 TetR family transcriptional regulator [Gammaproteobacteria bacterium]NIX56245.1 TetR family transcriptional regulator [candidate division Zixibacteria bacterium]
MAGERRIILDAAAREFAEVGLNEAGLESIASRAGLEPGVARALFVDKPTLLRELLKEATDPLVSGIALAVEELEDSREVVRKSLQLYDQWLLDHQDIVRIMIRCALEGPEWLQELYQKSLLPSEFYDHLQQLINQGRLRCKDLFILSLLFDSLIMFPHMMRSAVELMEPEQGAEAMMQARFNAMIDLFENGLYED